MKGGKIIRIWSLEDYAQLQVLLKLDFRYVVTHASALIFRIGDNVWWKENTLYWTPKDDSVRDQRFRMLGEASNSPIKPIGVLIA